MQEPTERQVTLKDYIRVLYRGRWIIIISFFAVVLSTAYFTFTTEPSYEAAAKLMIEEEGSVGESLFEITSYMKKETMINNQVEILKSRTLAEEVIRNLQSSPSANQLRILGNQPEYAKKRANPLGALKKWVFGLFNSDGSLKEQEVPLFDDFVENLRKTINVSPIRNTDMIEIKLTAPSPFEAAFLTNAVAFAYKEFNQTQSQTEVRQVKTFLKEQLDLYAEQLSRSEVALKDYKEREKVVALDQETQELVQQLAEFEALYNEALTDLESAQERLKYIDAQLEKSKKEYDVENIFSDPYLTELKRQIAEKDAELISLITQAVEIGVLDETRAEIERKEKQVEALKKKFKEEGARLAAADFVNPIEFSGSLFQRKIEVEAEIQALNPKVESLKSIVERYNEQLDTLPEKSLRLARLIRNAQVDEKIFIMLQEKFQEARISEVGQLGNVRIIDPAKEPKFPVKPKKKLNLILATLVGLGLGIGIAFVLEYMDNSVRTIEDIEDLNLTLMGSVPVIKPEQSNGLLKRGESDKDEETREIEARLVTHYRPKSPISESYRTLRTNIQFSKTDEPIKTILVTSSAPKEGKSTTVANLAITLAQMGLQTLLIDTDLRRPVVHKLFNVDRRTGITNVLIGNTSLDDAIQETNVDHLNIISCGTLPPNPSELLGSQRMREILPDLKSRYHTILFDSPPVIAVTDAAVLAPLMDGVLLVVNSGGTQREALIRASELLSHVHANVLGVLLNNIQIRNVYGSYYYYYYYHYYYGKDGEKKKKRRSKRKRRSYGYSSSEEV